MKDETLKQISIYTTIIGILILIYINTTIQPIPANQITKELLNKYVIIEGKATDINQLDKITTLKIETKEKKIEAVVFDKNLNIPLNINLFFAGTVQEYKNTLQLNIEKISTTR
ncbi:MAG TPA: hypothetical protein VJB89_02610 [Candidatus Nanoarchaeia archaeon]|nr:hypothetical protein [Candidatus Nanoarchaeia archaeon]